MLNTESIFVLPLIIFFIVMFGVALFARSRVQDAEDFIVAGRGLSAPLLIATLIATWFGAGSLSVSADLVREQGLRVTALEPFGVGVCLLLAGWIYARPMWEAKILTLADYYRLRFGPAAEFLQVIYSISYFGWIAVQLMAIGNIVQLVFGLDVSTSIILVTAILTSYTLLGGMWSVALTDAVQVSVLIVGLVVLTVNVVSAVSGGSLGAGVTLIMNQEDPAYMAWLPHENAGEISEWLGLFIVGALGSIASQDLMQRIFAARNAQIAVRSCVTAGAVYIVIAMMPVCLGLAANILLPEVDEGVVPALVERYLTPGMAVIFMLTLTAAITSTVDSALLGPASTFAQNLLRRRVTDEISTLVLTRISVVFVACASAMLALSETSAIDLLQSSFALGIPPLVILTFALYQKRTYAVAAVSTSLLGLLIWLYDMMVILSDNWPPIDEALFGLPMPLVMLLASVVTYLVAERIAIALKLGFLE